MSECTKTFNCFCYICGKFTIMPSRKKISAEICILYEQYFNIQVIQNKEWVPSIACTTCIDRLQKWSKGNVESMSFGIPMVWADPGPIHQENNCYACVNKVKGMNRHKSAKIEYQSVPSAQTPLPHSETVPIPKRPSPTEEYVPPTFLSEPESTYTLYQPSTASVACNHIECSQERMNMMVRQLKLSQARQIILTRHLKAMNILAPGIHVYDGRERHREFTQFFERDEENCFVFCKDIRGLMLAMGYQYKPEDWRLFIDSSKKSLKAVLLYVDNSKNPVPVALSTKTKETYESMKKIIDSIKYEEHLWKICCDLKVISLLRGLQLGYTKNMCFLCLWETRFTGNQYQKRDWPVRQTVERIHQHNVQNRPLIEDRQKILLPPLHIKLGLVKNFIKALVARENDIAYDRLEQIFPRLSKAKIKEGKH